MNLTKKQIELVIEKASKALAEYCIQHDLHHTVTGVSGGLDSAVTLALAKQAKDYALKKGFSLKNIGLILPCHSDSEHAVLAKKVMKKFGAEFLEIDLTKVFEGIEKNILKPVRLSLGKLSLREVPERDDEAIPGVRDIPHGIASPLAVLRGARNDSVNRFLISRGNVKARLRMALGTYFVANMVNGLVLSTDNFSEYFMGFWTLHGDVGDFGMIQELWKSDEIPAIAKALQVPQEIIDAAPTDGLGVTPGGDEAQMGAPYSVVDKILQELIRQGIDLNGPISQLKALPRIPGISPALLKKIAERSLRNAFKRKNPINLRRKDLGLL